MENIAKVNVLYIVRVVAKLGHTRELYFVGFWGERLHYIIYQHQICVANTQSTRFQNGNGRVRELLSYGISC